MSEKAYKPDQKFELLLINESTNVYEVLGISEERSDEIVEIVQDAYQSERFFTDTLKKAVEQMNHTNELVFAVMIASKIHSHGDSKELQRKIEEVEAMVSLLKLRNK